LIIREGDRCGSRPSDVDLQGGVDVVVKVRFRPLIRLSRRVSAGIPRPGVVFWSG
jgi:hypothetical protein